MEFFKFCDVFDMIGGISIGGLIVVMFGCLKMFVDECIVVYIKLFSQIFVFEDCKWFLIKFRMGGGGFYLDVSLWYDLVKLEVVIKVVVKEVGLQEEVFFKILSVDDCKV